MVLHRRRPTGRPSKRSELLIYRRPKQAQLEIGQHTGSDVHQRLSFALPESRRVADNRFELPMDNGKHRLLPALCYSAGLRVREVVALRRSDLDGRAIRVRQGKRKKDRYSLLAKSNHKPLDD
ncbi:MAG: tyrosine-type recombinase/integrase [Leptospirales bacterium]|nr:tyrosine-type recombinase/integrase [Leptospirales bacterium]